MLGILAVCLVVIPHMKAAAQLSVAAQLHIYALVQAQAYQVEGLFYCSCIVLGHPAGAGRLLELCR